MGMRIALFQMGIANRDKNAICDMWGDAYGMHKLILWRYPKFFLPLRTNDECRGRGCLPNWNGKRWMIIETDFEACEDAGRFQILTKG